jgi:tetratricopeptide (TPR) repeat protein
MKRVLCCLLLCSSLALAQDLKADRQRAFDLMHVNKTAEALPLLEKLVAADPKDVEAQTQLGFALYLLSQSNKDRAAAKALRARSKECLLKAKQLGNKEPVIETILEAITGQDQGGSVKFSKNAKAQSLMEEAELAFAAGEFEKALAAYQGAMEVDPSIYEAPLFAGDCCFRMKRYPGADDYFAKAVAAGPAKETAYRYWGNALFEQGKYQAARAKYIEGIVCDPYYRLAWTGISRMGEPKHPQFPELDPRSVKASGTEINIDVSKRDDDAAALGLTYSLARAAHRDKSGRHSLAEESEALKDTVQFAKEAKLKNPPAWLATLQELQQKGLIEAYVLLARPDEGIRQDYPAYLKTHRPLLVRYLSEYYH